ncbi:hypothetical protein AAHC03_025732, partial [Spirometra sp. Aus1]
RELCDLYGFWCSPATAEGDQSEAEDETSGICIRSSMLCDGFPDCWLDDPEHSPDEVGCKAPLLPEPDSSTFTNMENSSLLPESYPSTRGQSWTSKLPWLVAAFVPVVLLCALVRICSQRRQLDFADEVQPDQNGADGQPGGACGGTPIAQLRPLGPRYKMTPTKRGLLWAAGLRRTRSSGQLGCGTPDDYPKAFQLQPKRSVQHLCGGEDLRSSKLKIEEADEETEAAAGGGSQQEMEEFGRPTPAATPIRGLQDCGRPKCCNLQIDMRQPCEADLLLSASPRKGRVTTRQKPAGHPTGRLNSDPQTREHFRLPSSLMMSCWSEMSPSSSSSGSALPTPAPLTAPPGIDECCLRSEADPEVFFPYRFNGQAEREDDEEDSCAVCRQMRESGCLPNEADGDTSKSSPLEQTPSTSSTSDVSSCGNGQSSSPRAFPTQTTSVTECRASVHGEEREKVRDQASSPVTMQGDENCSSICSEPLLQIQPNAAAAAAQSQLSLTSSIATPAETVESNGQ